MIVLLSPAKTVDQSDPDFTEKSSIPFPAETAKLVAQLKEMSKQDLRSTLGISDNLAALNHERYAGWEDQKEMQCALLFDGEAYKGLRARTLSPEDLRYAQEHLRILSGLYGILRPLDAIKPYRLEMGTKLSGPHGKDLYALWGPRNAKEINKALAAQKDPKSRLVVSCASAEYLKSVRVADLEYPLVHCVFPGPAVYAKQARGAMVRHIIENKINDRAGLETFTGANGEWRHDPEASGEHEVVFVRDPGAAKGAGRTAARAAGGAKRKAGAAQADGGARKTKAKKKA
ncbi:unnamed protein product [Pedinophyceae sp. YPF-701]|nr:unnamed protein product [Pedinophyceae sp. YPF-701]